MSQVPAGGNPNPTRVFRRGEVIYKAGDPVTHLYLIQSGIASVQVTRGDKTIEITQVGTHQVLGEEALWGSQTWTASAVANNDVRAIPVELKQALSLLGSGSQFVKVFTQGLMEKMRAWSDQLLAVKLESDPTPCSLDRVVKLFTVIHTVASYTGTQKNGAMVVVWPAFKKYAQRTFLESPVRLEQAVNILVKLGYARLEFIPCETDPEAPDELGFVHFTNLERVKSFYEFYRKRHFLAAEPTESDEPNLAILAEIDKWNEIGRVILGGNDADGTGNAA